MNLFRAQERTPELLPTLRVIKLPQIRSCTQSPCAWICYWKRERWVRAVTHKLPAGIMGGWWGDSGGTGNSSSQTYMNSNRPKCVVDGQSNLPMYQLQCLALTKQTKALQTILSNPVPSETCNVHSSAMPELYFTWISIIWYGAQPLKMTSIIYSKHGRNFSGP